MNKLLRTLLMLSTLISIGGCWGATPWPQRGLTVNLTRSHADKSEIASVAQAFLVSHGFTYAGPAGYDAVNKTNTVIDFSGPNAITASIQLDRKGLVSIYFNQNKSAFTPDAQKIFDDLEATLKARWRDAVTHTPDH